MIHFGIDVEGEIRPLCGEWHGSRSWSRAPGAVTCPDCLERLRNRRARVP
jgi:hypothetical protein